MLENGTKVGAVLVLDGKNTIMGVRFKNPDGMVFDVDLESLKAEGLQKKDLPFFHHEPLFKYGNQFVTEEELQSSLRVDEFDPSKEEAQTLVRLIKSQG